jgi:hypothetical protein
MDTLRRAQLLPKSGIGVVAPWLVIAPSGNPVIRIDLRLLDRVELIGNIDGDEEDNEGATSDEQRDVLLVCGDLEVALHVADGPEAAARIAAEALPWTREHGGAEKSLPSAPAPDRASRPASYGRLVVISSSPDAEIRSDDELAGFVYELTEPLMLVGRTSDNHIIIRHRSISRAHAQVTRDADTGRYSIIDRHASNGLRVNGERCIGVELNHGDVVDLGHVRMRFVAPGEAVEDEWDAPSSADLDEFLFVGNDAVIHSRERIEVGSLAFRVNEVEQYALQGANLPLTRGRRLQAAVALLVVAAHAREAKASG